MSPRLGVPHAYVPPGSTSCPCCSWTNSHAATRATLPPRAENPLELSSSWDGPCSPAEARWGQPKAASFLTACLPLLGPELLLNPTLAQDSTSGSVCRKLDPDRYLSATALRPRASQLPSRLCWAQGKEPSHRGLTLHSRALWKGCRNPARLLPRRGSDSGVSKGRGEHAAQQPSGLPFSSTHIASQLSDPGREGCEDEGLGPPLTGGP